MSTSKSDRTKQHIIEKAAPFFNKKGYADTSLADIVEATGLTKGAIYGNFVNKDELALKVFDYNISLLTSGLAEAMSQVEEAGAKLRAMTAFYRNEYRQFAARGGCPLLNAATEADDNFPALKVKVRAAIKGWKKRIIQVIEQGKEQKTIRKSVDAEKYATLFIAFIEGGVMMAKSSDESSPLFLVLDKIEEMIDNDLIH